MSYTLIAPLRYGEIRLTSYGLYSSAITSEMKIAVAAVLTLASAVLTSASRLSVSGHQLVGEGIALSADASEGQVANDEDKQPGEESAALDIARAFKVDATRPDMIRAGIKIFNFSENEYTITPRQDGEEKSVSYRSSDEASKKTGFNFGISGGYSGFTAGISMKTSSLNKSKKEYTRIDHTIVARRSVVTNEALNPHEYLLPEVKDFLLNHSPQAILDQIGPFYVAQFTLGCKFSMSVVGEVTSSEQARKFEAEVKLRYMKFVDVSVGGGRDKTSSESCTDYTTSYATAGGDSNIWLSKTKTANVMLDEWKDSITPDNARPFDHKLKFIWKLLEHDDMDRAKALEVETYITAQWEAEASRASAEESLLVPATWNKSKKVEGNVILRQPTEESGNYQVRSKNETACHLVKGFQEDGGGMWGLDQLRCDDSSPCLKYGGNSYVGRLTIPKGLKVTSYADWDMKEPMNIYDAIESIETGDFWNRNNNYRAKGFKFEVLPGYTCGVTEKCV